MFVCINSETDQEKRFPSAAEVVSEFKLGPEYLRYLDHLEVGCTLSFGEWTVVRICGS
jgi:hypothetical protein